MKREQRFFSITVDKIKQTDTHSPSFKDDPEFTVQKGETVFKIMPLQFKFIASTSLLLWSKIISEGLEQYPPWAGPDLRFYFATIHPDELFLKKT